MIVKLVFVILVFFFFFAIRAVFLETVSLRLEVAMRLCVLDTVGREKGGGRGKQESQPPSSLLSRFPFGRVSSYKRNTFS